MVTLFPVAMLVFSLASSSRTAAADDDSPETRLERAPATLHRDDAGHVVEVLFHHHTRLSDRVLATLRRLEHLQRLGILKELIFLVQVLSSLVQ